MLDLLGMAENDLLYICKLFLNSYIIDITQKILRSEEMQKKQDWNLGAQKSPKQLAEHSE